MKVSISRSVGRAFALMELFRDAREPANATQLSRRLDAPHSSVVAVLHNLRELGYLSFNETDMTYFPTTKLLDLTAWLRPAPRDQGRLGALVDTVARETGHMVALASRLSLFVNTVMLRPGRFTTVSAPPKSVGAALTTSIHGLVILAQLGDDDVAETMRDTQAWLREAGARKTFDTASILASIEAVRKKGFLAGPHPTCRSTEIIAYAVKAAPYAVALHLPTCLSRDSRDDVKRVLETRVKEYAAGQGRVPAMQPAPAQRRPASSTQDFSARFAIGALDTRAPSRMLAGQHDAG
jgi:DNA-binding IclR family transcriptional regulator